MQQFPKWARNIIAEHISLRQTDCVRSSIWIPADLTAALLSAVSAVSDKSFCQLPHQWLSSRHCLSSRHKLGWQKPTSHALYIILTFLFITLSLLPPPKSLSSPFSHLIFSNLLRSPTPPLPDAFFQPWVSWAFCSHTVGHMRWRTYIICPLSIFSIYLYDNKAKTGGNFFFFFGKIWILQSAIVN